MAMIGAPPQAPVDPNMLAAGNQPVSPYAGQGQQQAPMPTMGDMPQIAAKKPGTNWLAILGDALQGAAGQPGTYAAHNWYKQQLDMQNQEYNNREQMQFERQRQMYDYQIRNPNGEIDQAYRGLLAHPEGDPAHALYSAYAWNKATPPQMITQTDGTTGITTSGMIRAQIPGAAGPAPGGMTLQQILAAGGKPGGQASASGNFPR